MNRRTFLVVGDQSAIFALVTRVTSASATSISQQLPALAVSRGVSRARSSAFDAQGNHRTGTDADRQSGEWLAAQVQRLGVDAVLEPFTLKRIDPRPCYGRVADRRSTASLSSTRDSLRRRESKAFWVRWAATRRSRWLSPNPHAWPTLTRAARPSRGGAARVSQGSCGPDARAEAGIIPVERQSVYRAGGSADAPGIERRSNLAARNGRRARRGDTRCPRRPHDCASVQRHGEIRAPDRRWRHSSSWRRAARLVAVRERARQRLALSARSDSCRQVGRAGPRLLFRRIERARTRTPRDGIRT